ncbi:MAG: ribonuclease HII [Ignavibacteria bacterium]|nr:ribonuclease HII [Ignavibacteria bacterium]
MLVCGIDEAGRGPLAGPVVVAAVVFPFGFRINGVKDSKKLSPTRRNYFYELIIRNCIAYQVQVINNDIIDKINILKSTMLGIKRCLKHLKIKRELVLIDGNYFVLDNKSHKKYNYKLIIKGDDRIFHISAASVIAKVTRDKIMEFMDSLYPEYDFIKNKGYPTPKHIETVKKIGITGIHRKTFCAKYL